MGRKWALYILAMLAVVGCTDKKSVEPVLPVDCPEVKPAYCPAPPEPSCPGVDNLLKYQNTYMETLQNKQQDLKNAQDRIAQLQEDLREAKQEVEDWRSRYYAVPSCNCDSD